MEAIPPAKLLRANQSQYLDDRIGRILDFLKSQAPLVGGRVEHVHAPALDPFDEEVLEDNFQATPVWGYINSLFLQILQLVQLPARRIAHIYEI